MIKQKKHKTKLIAKEGSSFPLVPAALLGFGVLIFMAYQPILSAGFTNWDDPTYVYENPYIRQLSWAGIQQIFTVFLSGNYHPLVLLSYAIEYRLFELNPLPYHVTNLLLHLANSVLLFLLLFQLTKSKASAIIAAFLFAIHPLHVESVAWVTERKDVLYTFFFLLSLLSYQRFTQNRKGSYYAVALGLFVLSCLSKGQAVVLPLFLLIFDYFASTKFNLIKSVVEKLPFFILSVGFGILAFVAQKTQGNIRVATDYNFIDTLLIALNGFAFYIRQGIIPYHLSAFYPYPVKSGAWFPASFYFSALFGLVFLVAGGWYSFKNKTIAAGFLLFVAAIAPVIQLVPVGNAMVADRYFYVSSIGLFLLAGQGWQWLYTKKAKESAAKTTLIVLTAVYLLYLFGTTYERTKKWENSFTFWEDVMVHEPTAALASNSLGNAYLAENNFRDAIYYFTVASGIDSTDPKTFNNLGNAYHNIGQPDSAIAYYKKALQLKPNDMMAWANIGGVYQETGQLDLAENALTTSIRLSPTPLGYANYANLLQQKGRNDEAIDLCQKAIQLDSTYGLAYNNLGVAYFYKGDREKAIQFIRKAARLGYMPAQNYLRKNNLPW